MPSTAAHSRPKPVLIGLMAIVVVLGLILLPTLRRSWQEAQRINRQVDEREAAFRVQKQKEAEFDAARVQVELNPNNPDAHLRFASLLGQSRRYTDALKHLMIASRLAPTRAEPHLAMAEVYQSNSVLDLALEERRIANVLEPESPKALAALGYQYIALNWNMASLRLLTKAAARFPDNPTLRTILALTLYQMRDYRGALREVMEAKRLSPTSHELDGPMIDVYNQLGQPDKAEKAADSALRNDPDSIAGYVGRARAQRTQGKLDEAEISVRRAMRLNPNEPKALYELALIQKKRGQAEEARATFEQIVQKNPLFEQASVLLGQVYSALGRPQDATRVMEVYNRNMPKAQARVRLSLKVGNEPENAGAHFELGKALLETQRYPMAVVEFKEALRLQHADKRVPALLAAALRGMNRPLDAEEALKAAR